MSTYRPRAGRGIAATLAIGLLVTVCSIARAEPEAEDKALATTLFNQGRALLDEGRVAEACRKLEESQRLDPGGGTLLNVAVCHEREGRTASAWTEFTEALTLARRDGRDDRLELARARIDALEPKLSKVTVEVPASSDRSDLEIRRDARVLRRPAWGIAMPVDPGAHVVSASAPGMKPWSVTVTVTAAGESLRVVVPSLESDVVAPPVTVVTSPVMSPPASRPDAPRDVTPAPPHDRSRVVLEVALATVGASGLVVGSVFGLNAISKHDEASTHCTNKVCSRDGIDLDADSVRAGNIATIAFGVGAAALLAGAYVWLTTPSAKSPARGALILAPRVGREATGLWLIRSW